MQTQHQHHQTTDLGNHRFAESVIDRNAEAVAQPLSAIVESFEHIFPLLEPVDRLHYIAATTAAPTILTTSGGIQSATLLSAFAELHTARIEQDTRDRLADIPVVFLDTGDIFPESHAYLEYLSKTLNLTIERYQHALTPQELAQNLELLRDSGLSEADAFDQLTKVRPMQQIIEDLGVKIWISGNRRDQSPGRNGIPFAEIKNGIIKVYPLADVTGEQVAQILADQHLDPHPLAGQFRSVGNRHDTLSISDGHEKSGRHNGVKEECGLHLGWVKQGKTLINRNDFFAPAKTFPLIRSTIVPDA